MGLQLLHTLDCVPPVLSGKGVGLFVLKGATPTLVQCSISEFTVSNLAVQGNSVPSLVCAASFDAVIHNPSVV